MSTRRGGLAKRCTKCRVHFVYCYCNKITTLELKTRVSIIMHKTEQLLTSNTALLTNFSLTNFSLFIRGLINKPLTEEFLQTNKYQPLYLYPSDDAVEITDEFLGQFDKPIHLIVPDGTWRQAKKIHQREPLLKDIPRVKINIDEKSIYKLRTQKHEFGLCTHEAIAYAMGKIESQSTESSLILNLKEMVAAHLSARQNVKQEI